MIELVIAMAITTLMMGAIGSIFYQVLVVPPRESDQLTAINELRLALDRIQHDGVQAHEYTLNEDPCPDPCVGSYYYGHFSSYTDPDCYEIRTVYYRYECEDRQLIREESIEGEPTTNTTVIAFHIAAAGDVSFAYDENNPVTVNMTVTLNPGTANEISETDTRYIDMRAAP